MATLKEVAERSGFDRWSSYQAILAVRDGRLKAPEEWLPEMAAVTEKYVQREMAKVMRMYDKDYHAVAARYLGIASDYDLDAWKAKTPGWEQKLADLHRQKRGDYECEQRARLRENISGDNYAVGEWARGLHQEIIKAVRKVITAPEVVVYAKVKGCAPRKILRSELLKAILDIEANALTIDGVVLSAVEIELPAAVPSPAIHPEAAIKAMIVPTNQQKFDTELRRRIAAMDSGPEGYRDRMVQWAQANLEGVSSTDAESLWASRAPEFPRKGGRHKRQKLR